MRRLKLPQKFALIAVLLITPFAVVGKSYIDAQNEQAGVAVGERAGIVAISPMTRLLEAVNGARAAAAAGQPVSEAGLSRGAADVDAALRRVRSRIHVAQPWGALRARIDSAQDQSPAAGPVAAKAWSTASSDLVDLITTVADQSELTLDPVLVSYYLQDSITVKVPTLMEQSGLAAGLSVSDVNANHDRVAIAGGALATVVDGLEVNLRKATAHSGGLDLDAANAAFATLKRRAAELSGRLSKATDSDTNLTGDPAAELRRSALAVSAAVAPQLDRSLKNLVGDYHRNTRDVALIAAAVLLLALWLFVGFYRSMTSSVNELIGVLGAVEAGDLRTDASTSSDEVGQMAVALNRTRARMSEVVDAIMRTSASLSSASVELSAVSNQMTSAASHTSERADTVSSGAEQISTSIQTVSAGTEEMGASINEIARQAADAARVASEAVAAADITGALMDRLGESSAEIDEVIKFIGSIAEQTNLLALNAAIEAARAGEAGKGFAVVASEVKELARDTAQSSEKIERRIAVIQADTQEAIRAIGQIASTIHQINDIQTTIASAVEEQAATTSEIARSVSDVAAGSNAIAASITDVAETARDTNAGAVETHHSAERLARMASELLALTQRFRLAQQPDPLAGLTAGVAELPAPEPVDWTAGLTAHGRRD